MGCMKRQLIACLLAMGFGCGAHAEDYQVYAPNGLVPGTPTYWNWSGIYVGGQYGMTSGTFNPDNATGPLVANLLRNTTIENEAQVSTWPQLSSASTTGTSYGGFVGFNQQWEDVIVGFELNYSMGTLSGNSSDSISRNYTASDGYLYTVAVNSRASMSVKDYGTFRARAGYVMDRFLPYVQVGGAVGRADVSRSVSVALTGTDVTNTPPLPPVAFNASASDSKKDAFIYGFTAGVGLDVAITENIFLRAEYEYIAFFPYKDMTMSINSGRVGVGVKF